MQDSKSKLQIYGFLLKPLYKLSIHDITINYQFHRRKELLKNHEKLAFLI